MSIAEKTLTLEEFLKLPETKPASEYHIGRIIQKPVPKGKHSVLQGELVQRLDASGKRSRHGRAFPELRCTFADRSIVPDVCYFTAERIQRDEHGEFAEDFFIPPDFSVEILSPDQDVNQLVEKLAFCVTNGVSLAWLVDPRDRRVIVFRPGRMPESVREGDLSGEDVVPGFTLPLEELFGWLRA